MDGGAADGAAVDRAAVILEPTTGATVTGSGLFSRSAGALSFTLLIAGAPAGQHGVHIHETGDCGMDGMNAGGHWDPDAGEHGMPGAEPSHLGDLGNMTIAADGTGTLPPFSNPLWTLGDGAATDVVGHAVVFHADLDDFGQPLGNAGGRISCGIIEVE